MRYRSLLCLIVAAGIAVILVCGWYLGLDWLRLEQSYARFVHCVTLGVGDRELTVAFDVQLTFRINCLAEGLGVLLGAILAAIGCHGLATLPPAPLTSGRGSASASD